MQLSTLFCTGHPASGTVMAFFCFPLLSNFTKSLLFLVSPCDGHLEKQKLYKNKQIAVKMMPEFSCSLQDTPPQYNASAFDVPVALYWGGNDWLADPQDVQTLMKLLPKKMPDKYLAAWQHLDFIWGLDAAPLVYDDIIKRILTMENQLDVTDGGRV